MSWETEQSGNHSPRYNVGNETYRGQDFQGYGGWGRFHRSHETEDTTEKRSCEQRWGRRLEP